MQQDIKEIKKPLLKMPYFNHSKIIDLIESDDVNAIFDDKTILDFCLLQLGHNILPIHKEKFIDICKKIIYNDNIQLHPKYNNSDEDIFISILRCEDHSSIQLTKIALEKNLYNLNIDYITKIIDSIQDPEIILCKINLLIRYGIKFKPNTQIIDSFLDTLYDNDNDFDFSNIFKLFYKNIYEVCHINDIINKIFERKRLKKLYCDILLDCGDTYALSMVHNHKYIFNYEHRDFPIMLQQLNTWIDNILLMRNKLTTQELKNIYSITLFNKNFNICGENVILQTTKNMIIYKYNLQILIGKQVDKPKFIYHDVVLIFVFLLKNLHLIELNADTLKKILWFILHAPEFNIFSGSSSRI